MTWDNVVNLERLEFVPEGTRENYRYEVAPAALASKMGARKLGYNVSVLPPAQFSSPYHFHHSEEELFLVLEGKAMLRQAGRYREVAKGDLIFFANSPEGAHQFFNHTEAPFKYLALSTMDPFEVCEYPDSQKVNVSRIKKVFQAGVAVDYWHDEADPSRFWPAEIVGRRGGEG